MQPSTRSRTLEILSSFWTLGQLRLNLGTPAYGKNGRVYCVGVVTSDLGAKSALVGMKANPDLEN